MASALTSSLRFLDRDGTPLAAPREWARGYVTIDIDLERWQELTLLRNGQPLDVYVRSFHGEPRVVADWPLSGTGHYRLELRIADITDEARISVWPRKITQASYFQLLDDLQTLPATIAIALQQQGALAGVNLPPPQEATLAGELQRLRTAIEGKQGRPGLKRVLHSLASDPYTILRSHELWLPHERVRRVHPTRLAQTFAVAHSLDTDGLPKRLPESQVEHTPDVYENRLVRAFHDQVHLRLRRLRARLEKSNLPAINDELGALARSLTTARREATFLDEVTAPRQLPTRLTMVLLRRSAYRAAFEGFLEFRRTVSIRLEEPALDAPLENLPSLYETWGTLQVIQAFADTGAVLGWQVEERLFRRDASGLFLRVLRNGKEAVTARDPRTGTVARLIPQRTYGRQGAALRSASYEQKPDVAIEIDEPGRPLRLLLFDPKYKLDSEELEGEINDGRPKKVDIDKMHAYRDAIRNAADERPVEYAAIIYPGAGSEQFGAGLAAIAARPGEATGEGVELRSVVTNSLTVAGGPISTAA